MFCQFFSPPGEGREGQNTGTTTGHWISVHTACFNQWGHYLSGLVRTLGGFITVENFQCFLNRWTHLQNNILKMALRSTSLSLCGEWFRVIKYSHQWDRRWKITRVNWIHFLIWKRKQTPLVIKTYCLQEETINSFSICFQKKIFNDVVPCVAIQHGALCQLLDVNDRCLILMVLQNKLC